MVSMISGWSLDPPWWPMGFEPKLAVDVSVVFVGVNMPNLSVRKHRVECTERNRRRQSRLLAMARIIEEMKRVPALIGSLWVVAVALLPAFGPLVDHHFAEKLPTHNHLGGYSVHTHAFEQKHGHAHARHTHVHATDTKQRQGTEAVVVVDAEASMGSLLSLTQTVLVPSNAHGWEPVATMLGFTERFDGADDIYIAPQSPPPKLLG